MSLEILTSMTKISAVIGRGVFLSRYAFCFDSPQTDLTAVESVSQLKVAKIEGRES